MTKSFWQQLKPPILALAPMAGYTDSAFRQICHEMGARVVYSEMISADAICFNNAKTLKMLKFNPEELPLVFQLFGSNPDRFAQATKIITKKFKTNPKLRITDYGLLGLDINFGCPTSKIVKNESGAALMNELDRAYEIIRAVTDNTDLPVSIKIRSQAKDVTAEQFIAYVKNLPWQTVMIHGRTLTQGFSGEIDYERIKKIKQLVPDKIVLANGGVNTPEDAIKTLKLTSADGLGLARGVWGNPWIFKNLLPLKGRCSSREEQRGDVSQPITWPERKKIILKHAELFLKYYDNLIPLRKHLVHYVRGQKNASELRQKLIQVETLDDLKRIL